MNRSRIDTLMNRSRIDTVINGISVQITKSYHTKPIFKKTYHYVNVSYNDICDYVMIHIVYNDKLDKSVKHFKFEEVYCGVVSDDWIYFNTIDEEKINNELYIEMMSLLFKNMKGNLKLKFKKLKKQKSKIKKTEKKLKEKQEYLKKFSIFDRSDKINNILDEQN